MTLILLNESLRNGNNIIHGLSSLVFGIWNAKLTYIQIFVPIFKHLDLGSNHLYLSSNHLYLASNHLYLGTNDLKIGINDLYLGSNDLYLSANTTICTYLQIRLAWKHSIFHGGRRRIEPRYK